MSKIIDNSIICSMRLVQAEENLAAAEEQIHRHREMFEEAKARRDVPAARKILDDTREIYFESTRHRGHTQHWAEAGQAAVRYERSMTRKQRARYWDAWSDRIWNREINRQLLTRKLEPAYPEFGPHGSAEWCRTHRQRELSGSEKVRDQAFCRQLELGSPDILLKLAKEGHSHLAAPGQQLTLGQEISLQNWEEERGGQDVWDAYSWVMHRLANGEEVRRREIPDRAWAALSKTLPNNAVLLAEDEHGLVHAYDDPDYEAPEDLPAWPEYPGAPESVNPKAGLRLSAEQGEKAILAAWRATGGERTTDRRIAEWVNMHRKQLHLEGHRWMSISNANAIKRRLIEQDRLKLKLPEESFRKQSQWRNLPASYIVIGQLAEDPCAVSNENVVTLARTRLERAKRKPA